MSEVADNIVAGSSRNALGPERWQQAASLKQRVVAGSERSGGIKNHETKNTQTGPWGTWPTKSPPASAGSDRHSPLSMRVSMVASLASVTALLSLLSPVRAFVRPHVGGSLQVWIVYEDDDVVLGHPSMLLSLHVLPLSSCKFGPAHV